jgi:branched-chain amino acid transport system ATP-binding protein
VEGAVLFRGERIDGLKTNRIVGRGIGVVPEGRRVFPKMTVQENLRMGAYAEWGAREVAGRMAEIFETFPRLGERRRQAAGTLSGGEQAMLAIGRALMGRPRLLLLDEPSLGLSPLLVEQIFELIGAINRQATTVFLVEQNARKSLALAHRGYVIQKGEIVAAGTARELRDSDVVRHAYLSA